MTNQPNITETETSSNQESLGSTQTSDNNQTNKDNNQDSIYGMGAGRRKNLEATKEKNHLPTLDSVCSLPEMLAAVAEIHLKRRDGFYMSPPVETIKTIRTVHGGLPEDAQPHFVDDDILLRRINAARNRFNEWLGRFQRREEMPSPVEAGPANYPVDKAREKSRLEREKHAELEEALSKIESGANGARQRALEAIGSSVGEQNAKQAESEQERMREKLEQDNLVKFRNPREHIGQVVRVNKKSVRIKYPHPMAGSEKPMSDGEVYPEVDKTTIPLDSDFLHRLDQTALKELDRFDTPNPDEARTQLWADTDSES